MKTGDFVFCVYDSKYRYLSKIIKTVYNPMLAESIWGLDHKKRTWEYMYFIDKPQKINFDLCHIKSKYLHPRYLGFTRISDERISLIENEFKSVENFINSSFSKNLKSVKIEAPSDNLLNKEKKVKNDIATSNDAEVDFVMPQTKSLQPMNLVTIKQLSDQNRIIVDNTYQRELVWTKYKKQLLIDSIIRNFDIPKIYFVQDQDDITKYRLVDGQQRINALISFMNEEFALRDDAKEFNGEEIASKKINELPPNTLNEFNTRQLDVVVLIGYTREQEKDIFHRMQLGEPLNAPERRRGIEGNCSSEIIKLAQNAVFDDSNDLVGYSTKRFANEDVCAKLFHQIYLRNITPLTPSSIELTYRNNLDITNDNEDLRAVRSVLKLINEAFSGKAIRLKKYAFLRIGYLFNELRVNYNLRHKLEEIALSYIKLEEQRGYNDERDEEDPDLDPKLREYSNSARADSVSNQEFIHDYLKNYFIKEADLVTKDNKRLFTNTQREIIYRQSYNENTDQYECQADISKSWYDVNACSKIIDESSYQADHINPHSNGGETKISNGKALCPACNTRKQANI